MLLTSLLVLGALAGLAVAAAVALAFAMRRPALLARLLRIPVFRRLMARLTMRSLRAARARAGVGPAPTDLELVLAGQTGPEAEQARRMLARMNRRQRAELSRMTMGGDGLAGMLEAAATLADGGAATDALGRAERRRAGSVAAGGGRAATTRKASRRRAPRKGRRGR